MSIHLRRGRLLCRNDKNHSNKYIIVFYAHKQVTYSNENQIFNRICRNDDLFGIAGKCTG